MRIAFVKALRNSRLRIVGVVGLAVLLVAGFTIVVPSLADRDDSDRGVMVYEVTIVNITPGQAFSPPVLATHTRNTMIFRLGYEASLGIQEIAENGNNAPLLAALAADGHVFDVTEGGAPLVPANNPGGTGFTHSATYTISASGQARFLSIATMLICTNDGFTGIDSFRLPTRRGETVTLFTVGYDARTEGNTEDFADLVPPCQGLIGVTGAPGTGTTDPELAEDGIVIPHPGIFGGTGLVPRVHGWSDPVAEVEIKRIS